MCYLHLFFSPPLDIEHFEDKIMFYLFHVKILGYGWYVVLVCGSQVLMTLWDKGLFIFFFCESYLLELRAYSWLMLRDHSWWVLGEPDGVPGSDSGSAAYRASTWLLILSLQFCDKTFFFKSYNNFNINKKQIYHIVLSFKWKSINSQDLCEDCRPAT